MTLTNYAIVSIISFNVLLPIFFLFQIDKCQFKIYFLLTDNYYKHIGL